MKFLLFIASAGMLLASVASQQQFYGPPGGATPSSSFNAADPLAGINLAQLLSLVGGQGGNSQSYGAPQQQQQQQQQFSAPIPAPQVAYIGPQQQSQQQQQYRSAAPIQQQYSAPSVQRFQAQPSNQYGSPSQYQQPQFRSNQYNAPAPVFQQQQQFSSSARSVSSQYGAPQQQQQQQFSGSARSLSSSYGVPQQQYQQPSNQYGVPSGAQASRNAQSSGFGSVLNAVVNNGGYSNTGSGNGLNDFSGNGGNSGSGNNGGALEQRIHKHVYIHVAPPEANEERPKPKQPSIPRIPEKHYKILFIKAPAPPTQAPIDLNDLVTPAPEQKTLVYVLLKKPDAAPQIRLPEVQPTKPSKPEVYFIRYKTNTENGGAEAQNSAINNNSGINNNNGINNGDLSTSYGLPPVSNAQGQPLGSVQTSPVPSNTYGPPGLRQVGPPGGYNN